MTSEQLDALISAFYDRNRVVREQALARSQDGVVRCHLGIEIPKEATLDQGALVVENALGTFFQQLITATGLVDINQHPATDDGQLRVSLTLRIKV